MATGRVPTTANSPLTAKGDLFGYSTAPARLAVGNDGEQIVADSSTSTGLRWQEPKVSNWLLNSDLSVWQRGTSFTANSTYGPDRWVISGNTSNFTTTQMTSSLPTGFRYGVKCQRNASATSTDVIGIAQPLETSASIPLQGKKLVFSFYAKAGANFSAGSSNIILRMYSGTGTDQNGVSFGGWTGYSEWQDTSNLAITTSWVRYSVTGTVPSNATQVGFRIGYTPAGTAGADDSLQITGVKIEVGSVATPFATATGTLQGELAACQRYFYRFGGLINFEYFGIGTSVSAGTVIGYASPKVTLRGTPTLTFTTASNYRAVEGTSSTTATSVNAEELSANNISFAFNASGFTIGRAARMISNNTTNGYIDISAEL